MKPIAPLVTILSAIISTVGAVLLAELLITAGYAHAVIVTLLVSAFVAVVWTVMGAL